MLPAMQAPNSTPPPVAPEDGRRLARQRVWARKQRTRGIRRRVAAITLSLFVAMWVAIFAHLVTGHDPALGASSRAAKTATSQTSTTATQTAAAKQAAVAKAQSSAAAAASAATTAQAASSSAGSGGSSTASPSSGSSSSAAPVTTSQS
jgi:type IV secretory pathway TrbL component